MSISERDLKVLDMEFPETEREAISSLMDDAMSMVLAAGYVALGDDRCAILEAAVRRYMMECKAATPR